MLKVFGNIILAAYLLVSTTGFTISKHYCDGEVTNVAVNQEAQSCCDGNGCDRCSTESEYVKLNEDLVTPVQFENIQIAQIDLMLLPIMVFGHEPIAANEFPVYRSESPPGRTGPDIFASNQSFLL